MSFARVFSAQVELLKGRIVTVEVDTARGMNNFTIVGLGDRAVDEARDRVGAALKNSGYESPKTKNQKTVISLSPADLKKEGAHFDLSIAIGFLLSEGMVTKHDLDKSLFIGELSLDGTLRKVRGILPITISAKASGFEEIYVPVDNASEASLVEGVKIIPVKNLRDLIRHLEKDTPENEMLMPYDSDLNIEVPPPADTDFSDIVGQESGKRGLIIAASGGHNILLYGPPGTGKTMLARALAGILPSLSSEDFLEVMSIHSIAGSLDKIKNIAPFRSPHHTSSYVSVIGGGTFPKPGEVTLSHRGVLFLDEFPEFDRRVIESLREPLEEGFVSIARAKGTAKFPARFLFVAAMNPCPCGFRGSRVRPCTCTASDLVRYKRKISGPLLDRIDMAIYVGEIAFDKLKTGGGEPQSEKIRKEVEKTRTIAFKRAESLGHSAKPNGEIKSKHLSELARLSPEAEKILNESAEKLGLSARSYHRTQKLARTIADLAESEEILPEHILEAVRYRPTMEAF